MMTGIGLLNEKPLHASLKAWYARPGDRLEVPVDGYVIDLVHRDLLVEIQTSSFSSIKSKLADLVRTHRLRLIYPIAHEKWLIKLARDGCGEPTRRKSPKRGRVEDLFWEMVSFPHLLADPNFSVEVLMIQMEEVRRYVGKRRWRRRGWVVKERRLLDVVGRQLFEEPADWRPLLPPQLAPTFTTQDLAQALDIRRPLAQKMAYCLRRVDVIQVVGRRKRSYLYRVTG